MSNPTAARFCLFVPIFILIFNTLYVSVSLNSPAAALRGHPSHSLDMTWKKKKKNLMPPHCLTGNIRSGSFFGNSYYSHMVRWKMAKKMIHSRPRMWNSPRFKMSPLPLENSFWAFYPEWINHFSEGGKYRLQTVTFPLQRTRLQGEKKS